MTTAATLGGSACPVCRADVHVAIDAGPFRLFACAACRSWCSDAHVHDASTSFVPENYFGHDAADHAKWDALHARLEREGVRVRSHLDVGCGTGAYLAHARARTRADRQVGIELDPGRADLARAANPEAAIDEGDALEVARRLSGQRFDLVTLWDVFEHVPEPDALLRALSGLLEPGGRIFIQTIHEHSLVPSIGRWLYRCTGGRWKAPARRTHDAHHLVFFSREGLASLADGAGLQIGDQWFDRLALARMDGPRALTTLTAGALALENALGNGLFVNVLLGSQS